VPSEVASEAGNGARNPRKRGRPRRSGSGTSTMAQTPSGTGTVIDESGDVVMAESGAATPSTGARSRNGRKRAKLDDDVTGSSTPAGEATPSAGSRKGKRKSAAVDPLPAEERARLNGIFEASFKAVEACIDPEYQRRRCDLFLEVPSKRDYPDYYVIIRHPIAMKNVRKKVKSASYLAVEDFHKDWKLMFDNARTYNEEGSMVYEDACEMQKALEDTLEKMTGRNYHTPIGTQSPLPAAFNLALQQTQQTQQSPPAPQLPQVPIPGVSPQTMSPDQKSPPMQNGIAATHAHPASPLVNQVSPTMSNHGGFTVSENQQQQNGQL
ncbi:ATP-dependent DNA helicase Snf21, partial [Linderina macrospora]